MTLAKQPWTADIKDIALGPSQVLHLQASCSSTSELTSHVLAGPG